MTFTDSVRADDLEHELNLLYQKQIEAEKLVNGPKSPEEKTTVQVNVIPVQATQAPQAPQVKEATVYQFPASQVEATPLNPSRADQLRKTRQEIEIQTEQAIVEQLEAQRLDWERKRAEALLKTMQEQSTAQEPRAEAQPVIVAPARAEHIEEESTNHEASEIKQNLAAMSTEIKDEKETPKSDYYMSVGAGMPDYVDNIVNLKTDGSFGVAMGFRSPTNMVFEASLYQSIYRFENIVGGGGFGNSFASVGEVDQYNLAVAAKYAFFSGRIRPLVGVLASFTRRDYTDLQCFGFGCQGDAQTNAFDVGTLLGGEVMMSDTFGIGIEYQYFRNISNRQDSNFQNSFAYNSGTNYLEDKEYTIFSVRGRLSF